MTFERDPVDAMSVPARLAGLRTMFNSFHHFRPADATAILRSAVAAGQPVGVFEVSNRTCARFCRSSSPRCSCSSRRSLMRPFRWDRLLWTYLFPLVPLTCLWDGLVSQLRAYTPAELEALGVTADLARALARGLGAHRVDTRASHLPSGLSCRKSGPGTIRMTRAILCLLVLAAGCSSSTTPASPGAGTGTPMRVLMLTATAGFRHDSIPTARQVMGDTLDDDPGVRRDGDRRSASTSPPPTWRTTMCCSSRSRAASCR